MLATGLKPHHKGLEHALVEPVGSSERIGRTHHITLPSTTQLVLLVMALRYPSTTVSHFNQPWPSLMGLKECTSGPGSMSTRIAPVFR
jgi:hypothetical protein